MKRKYILIGIISLLLIGFLADTLTTYDIVCRKGGWELNTFAIKITSKLGFLGLFAFILPYIGAIIYLLRKKTDIKQIPFLLILAIYIYLLFQSFYVVRGNTAAIITMAYNVSFPQEYYHTVTKEEFTEINRTFDREEFCKLI